VSRPSPLLPLLTAAFLSALSANASAQAIGLSQLDVGNFTADEVTNGSPFYGATLLVADQRMLVSTPAIDQRVGSVVTPDVGGARILECNDEGEWTTVGVLSPAGLLANSNAGGSCAFSGERAVLGAPFSDTFGINRGAVVVFDRAADGSWNQSALIAPPFPGSSDRFGMAVALDGDRLVIGADGVGRAFVYERDAQGAWNVVAELMPAFPNSEPFFGALVELNGDRAWVESTGTVFAFSRVGVDWNLSAQVTTSGADRLLYDPTNETLIVGLPTESPLGAVDVHVQTSPTTWALAQRITVNSYEDGFGRSLAIRGDRLIVGAGTGTSDATIRRAFVFEREPGGPWTKTLDLHGDAFTNSGVFGSSVALTENSAHVGVPAGSTFSPNGAVATYDLGTLRHSGRHLSTVEGRDQRLFLRSGAEHAWHWFVIAGSASGIGAGTALPGSSLLLPLTLDAYSLAILDGSATNLTFWNGPLDANGNANVDFRVPPLEYVPFIGSVLHHAYFVIDPVTFAIDHVSNPVPLELVP
jgi:hypothetical protein